MKKTIRFSTFETNSSSTHSMVVTTEEEMEKWKNGEIFRDYDTFRTIEELQEEYKESENKYEDFKTFLEENGYVDYENFGGDLETDSSTYTTKSGEVLHITCYYGTDY